MNAAAKACVAAVLLVVALTAHAQEPADFTTPPSRDTIAAWVQRGDSRELAWAAVYALKQNDRYFLPTFVSLAQRWGPLPHANLRAREYHPPAPWTDQQRDRRDAMSAVLDAIIQWNGTLSAESIRNLESDFPAEAFALLIRMPSTEAEPMLKQLFADDAPTSWYTQRAAAALLALHPPAGFAAALLKETGVTTHVFVSLPGDENMGYGSNGDCGPFAVGVKKDWPAIGTYALRDSKSGAKLAANATIVATIAGDMPIDVVRTVSTAMRPEEPVCGTFTPMSSTVRMALLAQMLNTKPDQLPFKISQQINLKVTDDRNYAQQVGEYVDKEEKAFRELRSSLATAHLLSTTEANDDSILPTLSLAISDNRSVKTSPLPTLQFRMSNVTQTNGFGF